MSSNAKSSTHGNGTETRGRIEILKESIKLLSAIGCAAIAVSAAFSSSAGRPIVLAIAAGATAFILAILGLLLLRATKAQGQQLTRDPDGESGVALPKSRPPLLASDLAKIRGEALRFSFNIGREPIFASMHAAELRTLAERLWADHRYQKQDPKSAALIYRLYSAALLFAPKADPWTRAGDALPWLERAIVVDHKIEDFEDLVSARDYLTQMVNGTIDSPPVETVMNHQFRVAMPGAPFEAIAAQSKQFGLMMHGAFQSPKEPMADARYLMAHRVGNSTVGQSMAFLRETLTGKFPNIEVGGEHPDLVPLPSGGTKVTYRFNLGTGEQLTYEWEVDRTTGLIKPLNEAAQKLLKGSHAAETLPFAL